MKICIFSINIYSLFNSKSNAPIGGTEVQLFAIASFFANKCDFQVSVITGDWRQEEIEQYGKITLFRSFSLKKTISHYIRAPFILWRTLKRVNADVFIASPAGPESGIIAFFCKIYRKKFIYRTAHQMDCNGDFEKKNGLLGWLYGYGLRSADVVVTQSEEHQRMLLEGGVSSVVIRNAFVLKENISTENKKKILWVSRCEVWKNPKIFLEIAKKLPHESFQMISPRQKNQKELFEEINRDATSIGNIEFIEKVPFFKIQKYFNEAKIFVGTSEYEGFPNTYLQACIGKTPTVSYKVNPDEFITKNNLGYCAKGNFEKMMKYIRKLLDDEKDWKEKSENAFQYVKKNHDIETVGKQWVELVSKF